MMEERKPSSFALRRAIIKGFRAVGHERRRGHHLHMMMIPLLLIAPHLIQNAEAIKAALAKQNEGTV